MDHTPTPLHDTQPPGNELSPVFDVGDVVAQTTAQIHNELGTATLDRLRNLADEETGAMVVRWLSSRRRRAATTRRGYLDDICGWAAWVSQWTGQQPVALLRVVNADAVTLWTAWARQKGWSVATQRRRLSALSSLFDFAARTGLPVSNPVDWENHADPVGTSTNGRPVGATRVLTVDQVHRMRDACRDLRDRVVFDLLYCNGLRVTEAARADIENLDLTTQPCTLQVERKRGHWVIIPLNPSTCQDLIDYVADRTTGPLLLKPHGQPADRHALTQVTQRLARKAEIPNPRHVTPHVLRASAITALLDAGFALADVQRWAGHARPETTQGYWERPNAVARDAALSNRLAAQLNETQAGIR